MVRFGLASGLYTLNAQGAYKCYSAGDYSSGLLHSATMTHLQPSTRYYYTCGDPARGWSQEFSFMTLPEAVPQSLPFRLGIVADLGQTENSVSTVDHLTASKPGLLLLAGDWSYADNFHPRWDSWGRMMEAALARLPLMGLPGNHEIEAGLPSQQAHRQQGLHSTQLQVSSQFVAYETRFTAPRSSSGSSLWYSFEVAGAHIVMLSSYSAYGQSSDQYAWLVQDLALVDRSRTPWLVVMFHAPWYNSNTAHQGEGDGMAAVMEPLIHAARADIVISGHVHAYERSMRVYKGQASQCGAVHIVVGDGGNREGLAADWISPQPSWSRFRESSYGHGVLDLVNATHAHWRWVRNADGVEVAADQAWLVRDRQCSEPFWRQQQQQQQVPKNVSDSVRGAEGQRHDQQRAEPPRSGRVRRAVGLPAASRRVLCLAGAAA